MNAIRSHHFLVKEDPPKLVPDKVIQAEFTAKPRACQACCGTQRITNYAGLSVECSLCEGTGSPDVRPEEQIIHCPACGEVAHQPEVVKGYRERLCGKCTSARIEPQNLLPTKLQLETAERFFVEHWELLRERPLIHALIEGENRADRVANERLHQC